MTTPAAPPAQQTPGDQRENHAAATGAAIGAVYAAVALVMTAAVAAMAKKVIGGALLPNLARQRLRATVDQALSQAAPKAAKILHDAMGHASGQTGGADPGDWYENIAATLDQAGDEAARNAEQTLDEAVQAADDVKDDGGGQGDPYTTALGKAIGANAGSSLSYRRYQAAQAMLDDLVANGITGYTDRSGRNWELAAYCEMATRTATSNAWDDMQAAAAKRAGIDLVKTGTDSAEGSCPKCLPWLGKTLSLTGATPGYPTVQQAKAAGWRHHNCRCFYTPAGMTPNDTVPVPAEQAAAAYEAGQRQRALERKVRAAHRAAQAAITPQARTKARKQLSDAKTASDQHRTANNVRMMKVTVQRRERPSGSR